MATLSDFVSTVLESVPNTPRFMVVKALRKIVRRFCKVSMCWQHKMVADFSQSDFAEIVPPEDTVFFKVFSVELNEKPLHQGVDYDVSIATKRLYWLREDTPSSVNVTLCIMPAPLKDNVPDFLLELYGEAIAYGAASEVARANPNDLPQYAIAELNREYDDGVKRATDMALNNSRRIVPPKKHNFY